MLWDRQSAATFTDPRGSSHFPDNALIVAQSLSSRRSHTSMKLREWLQTTRTVQATTWDATTRPVSSGEPLGASVRGVGNLIANEGPKTPRSRKTRGIWISRVLIFARRELCSVSVETDSARPATPAQLLMTWLPFAAAGLCQANDAKDYELMFPLLLCASRPRSMRPCARTRGTSF